MTGPKRSRAASHWGVALLSLSLGACMPNVRAAVSMRIEPAKGTPRDAAVLIDEEYIGPLGYVASRGVRLPIGEHRITIEREGYFPYDQLVEADREPIALQVQLVPIPD